MYISEIHFLTFGKWSFFEKQDQGLASLLLAVWSRRKPTLPELAGKSSSALGVVLEYDVWIFLPYFNLPKV